MIKELLLNWKPLFTRFVPNEEEELDFIAVLEDLCIHHFQFNEVFHVVLQLLNSEDINAICDDSIKKWSVLEKSKFSTSEGNKIIPQEHHLLFLDKMKKFIEQL